MLLVLSIGAVGRVLVGSVPLEIDWFQRTWSVDSGHHGWWRTRLPKHGPLQVRRNGALWLMDPVAGSLMITLDDAPGGPVDLSHRKGDGTLCDVTDRNWPVTKLRWSREGAGVATGHSPIRTRAVGLCESKLPASGVQEPPNVLESQAGKKKGPDGATGCGGFPGWMIGQLSGEKFFKEKVTVGAGTQWAAQVGVTSPTIAWEQMAQAIEKARHLPSGTIWKPYAPGSRPLPGDIYVLKKPTGEFRHVGVIIKSTGTSWRTADGGQGQGFAVGFRSRTFDPATGRLEGEDKQPAFLKGWVDLESLLER